MSVFAHRDAVLRANRLFTKTLSEDEKLDRDEGVFFARLEQAVHIEQSEPLTASNFPNIRRSLEEGQRLYPNTASKAILNQLPEASTDKSDKTNTAQQATRVDFLYNIQAQKAHLLSNAKLCHVAYVQIVQAITGLFEADYSKRRKLLNGVKGPSRRLTDSGIKHSKYNKLYLKMQDCYFDTTPPSLIILPVLPLEQIKGWDGVTPYSALVFPCGDSGNAAASEVLRHARETCSETDIHTAIATLAVFVKDIAASLLDTDNDVLEEFNLTAGNTGDRSVETWKRLVQHLRQSSIPTISIPKVNSEVDLRTIRVAKGTFDYRESCLPDPFLLALKGAINFSSFNGTKLMPACPFFQEDSDNEE